MRTSKLSNDRWPPWQHDEIIELKLKIYELADGTKPPTTKQMRCSNRFTAATVGTVIEGALTLG
jgi:hypothetical protein